MIRIALVEDEAEVRAQLQGLCAAAHPAVRHRVRGDGIRDGMELLDDYRPVYDILFLDVEMKHLDGMETARRVRELDKDVIIVFITNMAQYAIGGYAWARWTMCSSRCLICVFAAAAQGRRTAAPPRTALSGPAGGGRDAAAGFVPHLLSGKRGTPRPFLYRRGRFRGGRHLKAFEEKLAERPFARCNSGYLSIWHR